jgi:hypothetical protein
MRRATAGEAASQRGPNMRDRISNFRLRPGCGVLRTLACHLVRRDPVQAGTRGQSAHGSEVRQRAVGVDPELAHGATGGVQGVEKLPVRADRDIEVPRAGRIAADHRARERAQDPVRPDDET